MFALTCGPGSIGAFADRHQQAVVNSFFHVLIRYGDQFEILSFDELIEVAREQPKAAEDVREGKKNSVNFLVGQVMRKTKGKANPKLVNQLLRERLDSD